MSPTWRPQSPSTAGSSGLGDQALQALPPRRLRQRATPLTFVLVENANQGCTLNNLCGEVDVRRSRPPGEGFSANEERGAIPLHCMSRPDGYAGVEFLTRQA